MGNIIFKLTKINTENFPKKDRILWVAPDHTDYICAQSITKKKKSQG